MTTDASRETLPASRESARILVADDDESFRTVTVDFLRRAGYRCDCARDAREAAQMLQEQPYDLLITDICMPGNANLELLHTVQDTRLRVPVVVVTGCPTVWTAVEALRLSVVDYLIKPIEFPAVLSRISAAMDKGRLLQSLHQAREQTGEWVSTVKQLEQSLAFSGIPRETTTLAWPVDQYLELMAAQVARLALNLKTVMEVVRKGRAEQTADLCQALQCPRRAAYEQALNETINVLEKTKTAFKSKDLADLRKRLESLLDKT